MDTRSTFSQDMLKKFYYVLLACSVLLASHYTQAQSLQVDLNFTVRADTGGPGPGPVPGPFEPADPYGLDGSLWVLSYIIDNPTYISTTDVWKSNVTALISSSVTLTISGAEDPNFNGTFDVIFNPGPNGMLVPRYAEHDAHANYGLNEQGDKGSFVFTALNIQLQNLLINSTSPASMPVVGSQADPSDFDGLIVTAGQFFLPYDNSEIATYSIQAGTVTAKVIPEPSTYAILIAAFSIGIVGLRRFQKQ